MKPQIASLRAANSLPYEIMMAVEPSTGFQRLFMIYESHLNLRAWCNQARKKGWRRRIRTKIENAIRWLEPQKSVLFLELLWMELYDLHLIWTQWFYNHLLFNSSYTARKTQKPWEIVFLLPCLNFVVASFFSKKPLFYFSPVVHYLAFCLGMDHLPGLPDHCATIFPISKIMFDYSLT